MPIKNYTTDVAEERTVAEITGLLAAKGARSVRIDYDDQSRPEAVSFIIILQETPIPFRLPCNFDGVFRAMTRAYKDRWARQTAERDPKKRIQARKVAWRIVKDWVAAQMALVEAEQASLAEVFLPYAQQNNGQTMFQAFQDTVAANRALGAKTQ